MRAAIAESTLELYGRSFRYWERFCSDFGFPVWIDELPRAQQARMVGLFAGLCASEGHNRRKAGNKYQTFDGKVAAVAFAHKAVRNAKMDYRDPEFELVAQGYKRSNSQVERKQPVTTPMLLEMRTRLVRLSAEEQLLLGSIVVGFFFLDRSSELWGCEARQIDWQQTRTLRERPQRDSTRQAREHDTGKRRERILGGSTVRIP
jgi:hypothetical protein